MASADPFAILDHPWAITRIAVTKGGLDQTTRAYTKDTEVETAVSGHWSPNPAAEDTRITQDLIEVGDAILWTDAAFIIGDRVRVQVDAAGTLHQYRVKALLHTYPTIRKLIGQSGRKAWLLAKEADA